MDLDKAYSDIGYVLEQAEAAGKKGDHEVARKGYLHALKMEPGHKFAYLGLARCLRNIGDIDGAEENFRKAIETDAVFFQAYLGLAGVLADKEQGAEAFEILAKASTQAKQLKETGVNQVNILFFLGEIELELNELAEALGFFEGASQAAPNDAGMQLKIADTLNDSGNHAQAVQYYQKALELDPELAHVYNRLGITYRKLGKLDLARNMFKRALAFHPDDEHLIYNLAHLHWQNGEPQKAVAHLNKALEINPEFEEAGQLLDVCQNHSKNDGAQDPQQIPPPLPAQEDPQQD